MMALRTKDLPPELQARIAAAEGKPQPKAIPAHTDGVMNKLERSYADYLKVRRRLGEIRAFWFEAVKVRLAERCWFLCDFLIEFADGHFEFHDTKGYERQDAVLKMKFTAEVFPFPVLTVKRDPDRGWRYHAIAQRSHDHAK